MAHQKQKKRSWGRRLLALLVAAAALGGFFWWEQNAIAPEEITVESARLPQAFAGLRVALVSDVHSKEFGGDNGDLLEAVKAQHPDLIAITGDLVDRFSPDLEKAEDLARGLAAIAPTYYVTGNHEWALGTLAVKDLKEKLTAAGVTVLSNQYLVLERDGARLVLAGIDDPNGYADQKTLPELMEEIRQAEGDAFVLLLAHRNTDYDLYAQCGVDVTLCGHGHGGVIRLPFTDGLLSTDRTFFPSYTAGLYALEYGQLVVSRGLGNSGPSFRLFNRPHLPVVVLEQKGGG